MLCHGKAKHALRVASVPRPAVHHHRPDHSEDDDDVDQDDLDDDLTRCRC